MAKLVFTLPEIIDIAKENISLPDTIENISASDNKIYLRINPPVPLVPKFNTTLTFKHFKNGNIYLQLETNRFLDLIAKIFKKDVNDWIFIDLPVITIKVNQYLSENIRNLQISEIRYSEQDFIIFT